MPTVAELTAPYGNVLLAPQSGPGVCQTCFNLTEGYERCYACAHGGRWLDVVVPISYSVGGEQLHHALVAYKRRLEPAATRFTVQLAAVLWRFLSAHERCVSRALGVPAFPVVTTVPSNDPARDDEHPLHRLDQPRAERGNLMSDEDAHILGRRQNREQHRREQHGRRND